MPSKKSSKRNRSSRTNGTKKTIAKSGTRTKSRTGTHTRTHTRTHTPSKTRTPSRSRTTGVGGTRKSKYTTTKPPTTRYGANHTRKGPSSSLGPGLTDPLLFVFLIILALSVIVLLVVGIWLLAARDGWPHGLNQTGNIHYTRFISYGTACIVSGLLFIFVIVFILLAAVATTGAGARIYRLFAVFVASLVFIIFILMIITGVMFAAHKPAFIANIVRNAWTKTLLNGETVGENCNIQNKYGCQGWYNNQCRGCRPTTDGLFNYPGSSCDATQQLFCPRCFPPLGTQQRYLVSALSLDTTFSGTKKLLKRNLSLTNTARQDVLFGCRYRVRRRNTTFFIPFTVYVSFLAVIILFLGWKTCLDSSG